MAQHMLGLLIDHGIGKNDPVLKSFCDTTRSDADIPIDRIRLLKFCMCIVQNDRIFFGEIVFKYIVVIGIPFLGPVGHPTDDLFIGGIVMDIEMGRLEDLEVEGAIAWLVLAE